MVRGRTRTRTKRLTGPPAKNGVPSRDRHDLEQRRITQRAPSDRTRPSNQGFFASAANDGSTVPKSHPPAKPYAINAPPPPQEIHPRRIITYTSVPNVNSHPSNGKKWNPHPPCSTWNIPPLK